MEIPAKRGRANACTQFVQNAATRPSKAGGRINPVKRHDEPPGRARDQLLVPNHVVAVTFFFPLRAARVHYDAYS